MKKLLIAGALFLACPLAAEMISAVSYNPSRMGDYVYLAAANTYDNYQAVNTGTPTALLNKVYVNGGTTTVKNDSYIATLDAVNRLKQKAATLRANKLSVSGSENASLYEGATTNGFTLAGNDIPQPTASHVNTGSALSDCTLKWEDRITSSNQKVKLLALSGCKGSGSGGCTSDPDKVSECERIGGTWNYTTCFCKLSFGGGGAGDGCSCPQGQHVVKNSMGCCCEYDTCGQVIYGQYGACKCFNDGTASPGTGLDNMIIK